MYDWEKVQTNAARFTIQARQSTIESPSRPMLDFDRIPLSNEENHSTPHMMNW